MLVNNPHLPVFILSEIHRNPDLILTNFREAGIKPELFAKSVMDEINLGKIRPINPRHLIINIIALCIFPFIGKPILLNILFDNDPEKFQGFLEERKNEVTTFIIKSIAVKS
jgi:TetR/AcrR family transcriptional regulator